MSQLPFARQLLVLIVLGRVKRRIRAYARRLILCTICHHAQPKCPGMARMSVLEIKYIQVLEDGVDLSDVLITRRSSVQIWPPLPLRLRALSCFAAGCP